MKKYLSVLDFSKKQIVMIELTEEETKKSELYSSLYDFVQFERLDEKYQFDLGNSEFMISDTLNIRHI